MPVGYDDPTGGLPPAPDGLAWPPPHWFDAPAGASPLDQPAAPLAPDALGPLPEGAAPAVAPPQPAASVVDAPLPSTPPPPMPFGASSAPPTPPPVFGPQLPASVAEIPDVTVSRETPPPPPPIGAADFGRPGDPNAVLPSEREDRAVNPFGNEPDRQAYLNDLRIRDPQAFAELQARDAIERQKVVDTARTKAINDDYEQQQRNYAAFQQASAITRAKSAQLEADAQRVAATKMDPSGGVHGFRRIAGIIGAAIGGVYAGRTGQRNPGLDALNETINRGIDAQRADLASQREGIGMRRSALANEFAQNGDAYHSAEVMRLAAYKHADSLLAQMAQDYDPAGATALKIADLRAGIADRQQQAKGAYDQQQFKNALEVSKAQLEQDKLNEERRKNLADEAAKLARLKGGGAGAGSNTNPNFTVATGVFDPFTKEPVFGKRALSNKGEKSEERVVNQQVATYKHVQDGWARLKAVGARIDYHKSLGENVWSKFKDADADAYDKATSSLVVNITKELGDKLTQGQLDEQGHRIPQRASWFERRDVAKTIEDAQDESDQAFATDMNTVGIDGDRIIEHARAARATPPRPDAETEVESARTALANAATPSEAKDAQAKIDMSEQRLQQEVAARQARTADIEAAKKLEPPPPPLTEEANRPPEEASSVLQANRAMHRYGEMLKQFHAAEDSTAHLKGLKLPGDIAAANHTHEAKVGELAGQVIKARRTADELLNVAHAHLAHHALEERTRRAGELVHAGVDPTTFNEDPNPANPLIPDRSFAPNADPFATQSVAVPKKKH